MTRGQAIEVAARVHVPVAGLSVDPALVGRSHVFSIDRQRVEVHLPQAPEREARHEGPWGNDQIWCSSWMSATGLPVCYEIQSVDVVIALGQRVRVPSEALGKLDGTLFSHSTRSKLNSLSDEGERLATIAVDRWARTLRWKSRRSYLARPPVSPAPRHGVQLVDLATLKRFFPSSTRLSGSTPDPLRAELWNAAGKALRDGLEPPVWFDFLAEGEHRLRSGDPAGGVVHLAIAAEGVIRELLLAGHAAWPVDQEFRQVVNQVSIGRIVDRWAHLMARRPTWVQALNAKIVKRLFEVRNGLLHRAEAVPSQECRQFVTEVRRVVFFADQKLASLGMQAARPVRRPGARPMRHR